METLNTREIKEQAWNALKENPGIILTFLLFIILIGITTSVSVLIPIAGPFIAMFAINILQGKLMMKIEEKTLGDEEGAISNYGAFGSVLLSEILGAVALVAIVLVFLLGPIRSAINNWDTLGFVRWLMIMYLVIILGQLSLYTWVIFPKVYIASKYNDCSNYERKEIMNTFKENGLFKRSFLLELSVFGEVILLYFAIFMSMIIAVLVSTALIIPIYIAFIIGLITIVFKSMIARVVLYRELSNPTDY